MLVADRAPWERQCLTAWSLCVGLAAVVAIAAVSGLRLEAADPGKPRPQPAVDDTTKTKAGKTYIGRVTDKDTGRPIAGASVVVSMTIIEEPLTAFGPPKNLAEVSLTTDAEGTYRFTISPEQVATPSLRLSVGVHQPGYVDRSDGAPYSTIAKDEEAGKQPWFEETSGSHGARRSRAGWWTPRVRRSPGSRSSRFAPDPTSIRRRIRMGSRDTTTPRR